MPDPEMSNRRERTLTIEFHGLCLFGLSKKRDAIHVFLLEPSMSAHDGHAEAKHGSGAAAAMTHVTTMWRPKAPGASVGKATRIPRNTRLHFGYSDSRVANMPDIRLMADVSKMAMGNAVGEPVESETTLPGVRVAHVVLHGGTLRPKCPEEIGIWKGSNGALHAFPYVLEWTTGAEADDLFHIWHATEEDSPEEGDDKPLPPPPGLDPESQARAIASAIAHFTAYYQLMGVTTPPTIEFTDNTIKCDGRPSDRLQTVLSCPSAQVSLV